jgi:hypothetical protein
VVFYDDLSVDYTALKEQRLVEEALMTTQDEGPPMPGGGGGGGGGPWPDPPPREYPADSLWLEMVAVSNAAGSVILHGTVQDTVYELLSKEYLTNASWLSEGFWSGTANQDWTLASVPVTSRTNSLFLGARSWGDADGNGLPDWWEIQIFGTTGNDPYADPDNDGWANIQEFQNGTQPTSFDTPPPPRNVKASLDWTGTNAIITWESGGGPVSGYSVTYYGYPSQLASGGPGLRVSSVPLEHPLIGTSYIPPVYQVHASFPNGPTAASGPAPLAQPDLTPAMAIVRGPEGSYSLTASDLPAGVSMLRVFGECSGGFPGFDVPVSNLVHGVYHLPDQQISQLLPCSIWVQALNGSGQAGLPIHAGPWVAQESSWVTTPSFLDCSRHLRENLRFLLRSATVSSSFSFASDLDTSGESLGVVWPEFVNSPQTYFARPSSPTNYEYSGLRVFSSELDYSVLQERRPVEDHFLWRNFIYDPADFDSNWAATNGASFEEEWDLRSLRNPKHRFLGPAANPLPLAFGTNDSDYIFGRPVYCGWSPCGFEELGLELFGSDDFYLPEGVRNIYGLPVLSVLFPPAPTLLPGAQPAWLTGSDFGYAKAAFPNLTNAGYYFASQTPYFELGAPRPPLPGSPDFSVTNVAPLLIASVGRPFAVAGWARLGISNGYPGKFGYLEQYFDKAYRMTDGGVVTTNQTGLLSPYGEFFPTESGSTALVTMPDVESGQRGTGIVHVVKLQQDVDHNLQMDKSFAGPDNSSQARPMVWWINNDYDKWSHTGDPGHEVRLDGTNAVLFYGDGYGQGIGSLRDLEDLARLWICGMPALATNAGYQVTLSWGTISSGSPAINLFRSVETNGGIGYLTNETIASAQLSGNDNYVLQGPGWKLGTISPSQSFTFPSTYFTNSGDKYFLFEGSGIGKGELVLTISQGTNVLAKTSAWFDLKDVKDMFEHVLIENVTDYSPNTFLSTYRELNSVDKTADEERRSSCSFTAGAWANATRAFRKPCSSGCIGRASVAGLYQSAGRPNPKMISNCRYWTTPLTTKANSAPSNRRAEFLII